MHASIAKDFLITLLSPIHVAAVATLLLLSLCQLLKSEVILISFIKSPQVVHL